MASILTCVAASAAWCFCTAAASLFSSCCGNDKPSNVPPSPLSGRKRSVFLLLISICLALAFQFGVAPFFVNGAGSTVKNFLQTAWLDGCEEFANDVALQKSCVGNNGNYRVTAATTLFFVLAAVAAYCKPTANREAWPAKFVLYFVLVAATVVIPSDPTFSSVYFYIALVGGVIFICVQQLVILDLAHNWNDSWVEKSNQAEAGEAGSGKKWLTAILISCAILFLGAIGAIVYMLIEFTGCSTNNTFISLTLIFCILLTTAQMTGDEGSLLSSACISAWAAFLCHSAVTKNPDPTCNPKLGDPSGLSIAFGLSVTLLSLCWTGWSYTAEDKLVYKTAGDNKDEEAAITNSSAPAASEVALNDEGKPKRIVTGVVTGGTDEYEAIQEGDGDNANSSAGTSVDPTQLSNSWRLNIALAAVSCWIAMTLTEWGEIQSMGNLANPTVGRVSMWVIVGSQWFVMSLYVWSLVAPRLFPNRDFS